MVHRRISNKFDTLSDFLYWNWCVIEHLYAIKPFMWRIFLKHWHWLPLTSLQCFTVGLLKVCWIQTSAQLHLGYQNNNVWFFNLINIKIVFFPYDLQGHVFFIIFNVTTYFFNGFLQNCSLPLWPSRAYAFHYLQCNYLFLGWFPSNL